MPGRLHRPTEEADFYRTIGAQLRSARIALGYTQKQMAEFTDMTRPSISNIEAGRQALSAYDLVRMCGLLGVDVPGVLSNQQSLDAVGHELRQVIEENRALRRRIARIRVAVDSGE